MKAYQRALKATDRDPLVGAAPSSLSSFGEYLDETIRLVKKWPVGSFGPLDGPKMLETVAKPGYQKLLAEAKKVVRKATDFGEKTELLAEEVMKGIDPTGDNWFMFLGAGSGAAEALREMIRGLNDTLRTLRTELSAYADASNSVIRLQEITIRLLESARSQYALYAKYQDSLYAKVTGLINDAWQALKNLVDAARTMLKVAGGILKNLPWILGGGAVLFLGWLIFGGKDE